MKLPITLLALAAFLCSSVLFAEDVLRFRGDNSQGKYNEHGLLDRWPAEGLKPKWINRELGEGYGSVTKVRDRLYLTCLDPKDSKKESVVCLDLNGKQLWQQTVGGVWEASYPLPRVTPTYFAREKPGDDKLLVISGNGELYCLAAADGKPLWSKEVSKTYESQFGGWGMAENVIVKDSKVFVNPCGTKALAVAYNIADGSVAWEADPIDDTLAYVTPILYENLLIIVTFPHLSILHVDDGKLFWRSNFLEDSGGQDHRGPSHCNPPILKGNQLFVAEGYEQGGAMYEFLPDGKGVKILWHSKVLDPHVGGIVEVDGRIYGSNWLDNNNGKWCCLDWNTGKTIYEEAWGNLGKGAIIFADGKLYLYEDKRGTLGLMVPGDMFEPFCSFQLDYGSKEHWAHPVISDGVLYVRHGNALAAYDIKK
jgi:outer membrane protein assembly factor BamB